MAGEKGLGVTDSKVVKEMLLDLDYMQSVINSSSQRFETSLIRHQ